MTEVRMGLAGDVLSYRKGIKAYRYEIDVILLNKGTKTSSYLVFRANNKLEADEIANKWLHEQFKEISSINFRVKMVLVTERILTYKEQRILDEGLKIAEENGGNVMLTPNSKYWERLS